MNQEVGATTLLNLSGFPVGARLVFSECLLAVAGSSLTSSFLLGGPVYFPGDGGFLGFANAGPNRSYICRSCCSFTHSSGFSVVFGMVFSELLLLLDSRSISSLLSRGFGTLSSGQGGGLLQSRSVFRQHWIEINLKAS